MKPTDAILSKNRIDSIDALRGLALLGILMVHCMEHFDLMVEPKIESPLWQDIDKSVFQTLTFIFAGKSYAIFSLLFGLGFFMQMDSYACKGIDFRLRFVWRLTILFVFGYLNGLIYMGEFFVVYAILGIFLIPLYKVPAKWLIVLSALLFLQIPDIIQFIYLLNGHAPNEPTAPVIYMNELYNTTADLYVRGSFTDVLHFNLWKGQFAKLLWMFNNSRYLQLIGLFILGLLIGRSHIYKDESRMVKYSRKFLPYCAVVFLFFYAVVLLLPYIGVEGFALYVGNSLFKMYANLGMMMIYVCGFIVLYYHTGIRTYLDKLAPVGRMSVTNYMAQSLIGVCLFYGFGANLAIQLSFLQCFLLGLVIYMVQIIYSNWWMKRFYYGPMEWLWRVLTWFKPIPLKRNK